MTAETLWFSRMNSPIGTLAVVGSDRVLCAIEFDAEHFPSGRTPRSPAYQGRKVDFAENAEAARGCVSELEAYFAGELRHFSVALDLRGTDFQKLCWQALLRIPYGATCSYADIAREVGRPTAFRAVGMANHSNPIPIIVPCHRVLATNGSLCGYGGGLNVKERLLRLERAIL